MAQFVQEGGAHLRAEAGFVAVGQVQEVIPQAELEEIAARYKRVAGFDVERLRTV